MYAITLPGSADNMARFLWKVWQYLTVYFFCAKLNTEKRISAEAEKMKIGIVGSRRVDEQVKIEILRHIPEGTTEIVSGGADGVDTYASELAELLHIPLKVFLPDYEKYGKIAVNYNRDVET